MTEDVLPRPMESQGMAQPPKTAWVFLASQGIDILTGDQPKHRPKALPGAGHIEEANQLLRPTAHTLAVRLDRRICPGTFQ